MKVIAGISAEFLWRRCTMTRKKYVTVDEYMEDFEGVARQRLEEIRQLMREELPVGAIEKISYNIPTYTLDPAGKGFLVYFAGFAHHVSLYPLPQVKGEFAAEVEKYQKGKGTLQFPHTEPLPTAFIRKLLTYYPQRYQEYPKK